MSTNLKRMEKAFEKLATLLNQYTSKMTDYREFLEKHTVFTDDLAKLNQEIASACSACSEAMIATHMEIQGQVQKKPKKQLGVV